MDKRKVEDETGSYMAELTITVLARSRETCDKAVEVITYAANCAENEHDNTAIIVEGDIIKLGLAETSLKLNELSIEPDEVGL